MKRLIKATALAAASCAAVIGAAGAAAAHGGASASGSAANSPGLLSGNVIQVPINLPINVCGNSIDVIGLLNPAAGNVCK
ncbi:chaplin [Streptomyces sp. RPT161]|uniref:chaplin n=1 Tax=Streptomyces sp. RPT161 TaxID=3015993 RepID=UPI0022B92FB5|nr:chaplin [Streptomyces sp. RPT161]